MSHLFGASRARRLLALALFLSGAVFALCTWWFRVRVFFGDPTLDDKTYVAPSLIPGAGNGLFAARNIQKGEVIAEMGGQLVFYQQIPPDQRGYLFRAPLCAHSDLWPFDAIDGRVHGGRASKINFAPRLINDRETHLQNARGWAMCRRPYVLFTAERDIAVGEEILASYGPHYNYDFMKIPAVQDYFCRQTGIDCSAEFRFEP
jgi:SET domain-containing protein